MKKTSTSKRPGSKPKSLTPHPSPLTPHPSLLTPDSGPSPLTPPRQVPVNEYTTLMCVCVCVCVSLRIYHP